ncbi:MAG: coenzyme F420-0:L-glutamate ligase [Candidatus Bathyarchaeia archaeon]
MAKHGSRRMRHPEVLKLIPVHMTLIRPGTDLPGAIRQGIRVNGLKLRQGDIIAVASKLASTAENRLIRLGDVTPSRRAYDMGALYTMDPRLVEVVIREADQVLGGLPEVLLTLKNGILTANAGVDVSNTPPGYASLWPRDPARSADEIRERLSDEADLAVLIVDSRVTPLRLGTVGLALAFSGVHPTLDLRGSKDIYGKPLHYTWHGVADDLASAAHYLMGEADEGIPIVIIRGAKIGKSLKLNGESPKLPPDRCLYMSVIHNNTIGNT